MYKCGMMLFLGVCAFELEVYVWIKKQKEWWKGKESYIHRHMHAHTLTWESKQDDKWMWQGKRCGILVLKSGFLFLL